MNNKGIEKIKTAGTIGYIASILLIVVSITAMVFTGIVTAGAVAVSGDNIEVNVSSDIDITSSGNFLGKLNKFIKLDGVDDLSSLTENPSKAVDGGEFSDLKVTEKDGGLVISAKSNEISFGMKRVIVALVFTFLFLGAATVMLEMLKYLMKALKSCETPFCDSVIKWMTRFGYSLIPLVVIKSVCDAVWSSITGGEIDFSLDLSSILIFAVVYVLIIIFKYGAQLQRESDETL